MTKETIIKSTLKYLVKRQIEEGSVGFAVDNDSDHDCCWDDVLAWIEAQPSEDCVNRSELQRTMDSLPLFRFVNNDHEEADDYYNCESVDMVIRNLPSVTPRRDLAETSQDCISRQKALDAIGNVPTYNDGMVFEALSHAQRDVALLPPVTPERPKGKWIIIDDCELFMAKCSECGEIVDSRMINKYPYCHCGAYMGGADETN